MSDRESIVLVTIDSLRADHCGYLGAERALTPTLDRLASEGVAFEQAIAPGPRTPSSVPTTFTGHYDRSEELAISDWLRRYDRISAHLRRHRTLPERLQDRGYTTIGITANPWTQNADFDHGFDRFVEIDGDDAIEGSPLWTALDTVLERVPSVGTYNWGQAKHWLVDWTDYYETVLEAIETARRPFFCWVFLLDVHQPYLPPRQHRVESSAPGMYYANVRERMLDDEEMPWSVTSRLERAYRDAVRSTDAFLAELSADLSSADPAMVVHSDHGEAFGEHGAFGHEQQLYEENLHVPLVVANTEVRERVARPVSLAALPDIVTDVADGTFGSGEDYAREYVVASTEDERTRALRGERWKYVQAADGCEVYDLDEDPGERRNLHGSNDDADRLLASLLANRRARQVETIEITAAVEQLTDSEGSV